jgi:hypothetical protein
VAVGYFYGFNPMHKGFNLGLIGIIFSMAYLIVLLFLRKHYVWKKIGEITVLAGLTVVYFLCF